MSVAALSEGPNGKRLSHQRCIQKAALSESRRRLLGCPTALDAASSFEELHSVVELQFRPVQGIGELAIHDMAFRTRAKLGLEPKVVFLHAGTRVGARVLWTSRAATSP